MCPPILEADKSKQKAAKKRYRKTERGIQATRDAAKKYRALNKDKIREYESSPLRVAARNAYGRRKYQEKKAAKMELLQTDD